MKLFAWGANSYGQLGLGYKSEQVLSPEIIHIDEIQGEIVSIAGGAGHSLILDKNGSVYSSGWNHKGQSGKEEESLKFTKINQFCEHGVEKISCGWDFSAAICKNNDIYVWGSNNFMQISLKVKNTSKPTLLEGIKAKSVSCGVRHMAIVTIDHKVLICGSGNKGQLGKNIPQSEIMKLDYLDNIKSVSCGQFHTLALKNDGSVFSFGNNKFGQLGHYFNDINSPKLIEFNNQSAIKSIHSGWTHNAFLTNNGTIFTFGRNTYGQLGRLTENNYWEPQKVDIDNVKMVDLGSEHNCAVTNDGKLFSWGWNEHGNCGTGDVEDIKLPKQILNEEKVIFASCGTGQSFAVVE